MCRCECSIRRTPGYRVITNLQVTKGVINREKSLIADHTTNIQSVVVLGRQLVMARKVEMLSFGKFDVMRYKSCVKHL